MQRHWEGPLFREAFLHVQQHEAIATVGLAGFLRANGTEVAKTATEVMNAIAIYKVVLINSAMCSAVQYIPALQNFEDIAFARGLQAGGVRLLKVQTFAYWAMQSKAGGCADRRGGASADTALVHPSFDVTDLSDAEREAVSALQTWVTRNHHRPMPKRLQQSSELQKVGHQKVALQDGGRADGVSSTGAKAGKAAKRKRLADAGKKTLAMRKQGGDRGDGDGGNTEDRGDEDLAARRARDASAKRRGTTRVRRRASLEDESSEGESDQGEEEGDEASEGESDEESEADSEVESEADSEVESEAESEVEGEESEEGAAGSFIDDTACTACGWDDDDEGDEILLCDGDGCEHAYHQRCLPVPLEHVPHGEWFCPECTAAGRQQKGGVEGRSVTSGAEHRSSDLSVGHDRGRSCSPSIKRDADSERGAGELKTKRLEACGDAGSAKAADRRKGFVPIPYAKLRERRASADGDAAAPEDVSRDESRERSREGSREGSARGSHAERHAREQEPRSRASKWHPGATPWCHQCSAQHEKTFKCMQPGCVLHFCERCLRTRYGVDALNAARRRRGSGDDGDGGGDGGAGCEQGGEGGEAWKCPRCQGRCNCSLCMRARGLQPTGSIWRRCKKEGWGSVDEYLQAEAAERARIAAEEARAAEEAAARAAAEAAAGDAAEAAARAEAEQAARAVATEKAAAKAMEAARKAAAEKLAAQMATAEKAAARRAVPLPAALDEGRAVRVWWSGNQKWFTGCVVATSSEIGKHNRPIVKSTVLYDDGQLAVSPLFCQRCIAALLHVMPCVRHMQCFHHVYFHPPLGTFGYALPCPWPHDRGP